MELHSYLALRTLCWMMAGQKYQKLWMLMIELTTMIEMMKLMGPLTQNELMFLWRKSPRMPQTEIANSLTQELR